MFTFHMDDKFVEITDFSEHLNGDGNLSFNVSNNALSLNHSSFSGLSDLRAAIADGEVTLKVKDEDGCVIWESTDYVLQNASFNANEGGIYFSAYFNQFAPQSVDGAMAPDLIVGTETAVTE